MEISISCIKLFKACRRAYELKYIEGLEPMQTAIALQTGRNYHEKLQELYENGRFDITDYSRESAMALAYEKYIYPNFDMETAEKWVSKQLCDGITLVGRVDGVAVDGRIIEHKTTGMTTDEYEYNLQWDEQLSAYMLMTGCREAYYTICRKPTIRQKKAESDYDYFTRMTQWYDEDTDSKIKVIKVSLTDEEIEQAEKDLISISDEIKNCENYYRNTCHCNTWGRRCEYSQICLNYDPNQEYVEFVRKEGRQC